MKTVTQPRALETREKILQAAARLFALKGYHDTKLEEVLAAAQVTKGAFFHHFRDREDLGFAVLDWHMGQRRQLLDAIEQELPRVLIACLADSERIGKPNLNRQRIMQRFHQEVEANQYDPLYLSERSEERRVGKEC